MSASNYTKLPDLAKIYPIYSEMYPQCLHKQQLLANYSKVRQLCSNRHWLQIWVDVPVALGLRIREDNITSSAI